MPAETRTCKFCDKKLRPIKIYKRVNGTYGTDWNARQYHKKCFDIVLTKYKAMEYMNNK